jgi:RNA polymerase I-specific transcription-initiation factor
LDDNETFNLFDDLKRTLGDETDNQSTKKSLDLLYSIDFKSFRSLYYSIVQNFVSPLSEQGTTPWKKRRGEISKIIAVELFLATLDTFDSSSPAMSSSIKHGSQDTPHNRTNLTLTILGKSSESQDTKGKRRALPAPGQQKANLSQPIEEERVSPLKRHVNFTKPLPVSYRVTERLLGHWDLGEDPSDYNYLARALSDRRERELEEMTAEVRESMLRKEEQRSQRQAQESQKFSQRSQQLDTTGTMGLGRQLESLLQGPGDSQSLLRSALRPSSQLESQISINSPSQRGELLKTERKEKDAGRAKKKSRTKGF